MRQFKILCTGLTLVVGTAGSIRGGDDDRGSVWADDLPHATWTDHLQRPPTFFSPAGWSPSFFVTDQTPEMFGVQAPSMTGVGCDSQAGVGCAKCEAIDPVMAEFIATDRQNSPVARFGASLQLPSLPDHSTRPGVAGAYSPTQYTAPAPMFYTAPVYAHPPRGFDHAPIAVGTQFVSPMSKCLNCPPPVAYHPTMPNSTDCCRSKAVCGCPCKGTACCAFSTCKCSESTCCCTSAVCKCTASTCKSSDVCKGAGSTCKCAASACKCSECACDNDCSVAEARRGEDFVFTLESDHDDCDDVQDRLEHILEASRHLELAGMKNEAHELRKQCVAEVSELMRRLKIAESELADLRKESSKARQVSLEAQVPCPLAPDSACCKQKSDPSKMVMVQAQIIEVNRTKLRKLGLDFASADGKAGKISSVKEFAGIARCLPTECMGSSVLDNGHELFKFLETLQKEGVAQIRSRPQVTTLSGQAAMVQIQQAVPLAVPQRPGQLSINVGTTLEIKPIVIEGNQMRLEARADISELDPSKPAKVGMGAISGLQNYRMETAAKLTLGQSLVMTLDGLEQPTDVEEMETEILTPADNDGSKIFRKVVTEKKRVQKLDEVELLIVLRPAFVGPTGSSTACVNSPCSKGDCIPCTNCEAVPSTTAPAALQSPFDQ